jgi:hypothetical protein
LREAPHRFGELLLLVGVIEVHGRLIVRSRRFA